MKPCPYCGYSNLPDATQCHKCEASFLPTGTTGTVARSYWIGPVRGKDIRHKALVALVIGLLIMVYWGGYGPWPVVDDPRLASIRGWLQPLLIYGGAVVYGLGWVANWV